MKRILLMSLGSRGDMEPFLALGETLQAQGHVIGFCFPAQFETHAHSITPHFYPQDKSFIDLVNSTEIKNIMGQVGSGWSRLKIVFSLLKKTKAVQEQMILDQAAAVNAFKPDEIIFHIKCIYPVFWKLWYGGKVKLLSPIPALLHPVNEIPHVAFGAPKFKAWNRFTYTLARFALIKQSILGYGKTFLRKHQIKLTYQQLKAFYLQKLEVQYSVSPQLFKRPAYWPPQAKCVEFLQRKQPQNYKPDKGLSTFLAQHPNSLYVGFGSMSNAQPKKIAKDLIAVCQQLNIALILNTSWGGLEPPKSVPKSVFVIQDVPFDYLFPKVGMVVHHGGAGTTQTALAYQKPQAIIPHIADQFFWNRQIAANGYGVLGFPIKKWQPARFEALLQQLKDFTLST